MRRGAVVWLTGLSGAGKSTIAAAVVRELARAGMRVELLDADRVRAHLSAGLGFERAGREENVRRLVYVAGLLSRHGVVAVVAAISPYRAGRAEARAALEPFVEVFVDAPVPVCEERDPVGLYRRFRAGEVRHMAGLDELYEAPERPEVHCRTEMESVEACVGKVMRAMERLAEGLPGTTADSLRE